MKNIVSAIIASMALYLVAVILLGITFCGGFIYLVAQFIGAFFHA